MVAMHTVHGKGDTVGWGLLDMPGWGGNCFVKCSGGCPGGASNLTIMDKRFDGQIE